jgi:8-amino-3,8-dideoxy-alpha-D-manno-octulosonate transaminase
VPDYENLSLPVSDAIMQRLVMIQIMVNWSDEKLKELQAKLRTALQSALNK